MCVVGIENLRDEKLFYLVGKKKKKLELYKFTFIHFLLTDMLLAIFFLIIQIITIKKMLIYLVLTIEYKEI